MYVCTRDPYNRSGWESIRFRLEKNHFAKYCLIYIRVYEK